MRLFSKFCNKKVRICVFILLILLIAFGSIFIFKLNLFRKNPPRDVYKEFISESYDVIKKNYWDDVADDKLSELFRLGIEKIIVFPQRLEWKNKQGVINLVINASKNMDAAKKRDFETKLVNMVAANLSPFGRSSLYTQKQEVELKNKVNNINPKKDLYKDLGISKNASKKELSLAYDKKVEELTSQAKTSTEAAKQLEQAQYSYQVLSDTVQKQNYDQYKVEPTVFTKDLGNGIFYFRIKQLSPETFNEVIRLANATQNQPNLNSLIIDLRGNIGGAIDLLQYFLGPFIGNNQYAYDFYHQGQFTPFKTKVGWLESLVKFKKVVVLIDGEAQSSAEVMIATFKKYRVGVVVGSHTKGWGSVESVFPLKTQFDPSEKYSLFLVHSLTLREDNEPIEGRGVDPDIDTSTPNWEQQLLQYFSDYAFANTVKSTWNNQPLYSGN